MADEQPKSRPQAPEPSRGAGAPPPRESVYGGQWGRGGKQSDSQKREPDRPQPIQRPPKGA